MHRLQTKKADAKRKQKNRTESKAKEENIDEQFNLAFQYLLGEGCKPDSYKALEWFEAAQDPHGQDHHPRRGAVEHDREREAEHPGQRGNPA